MRRLNGRRYADARDAAASELIEPDRVRCFGCHDGLP
jgi:hypothetical protein